MKKLRKSLIIGLIAVGTYAVAGSVTIPNSFTANTTAKASEVNANFSAVKTAVDGNAADVATNRSNISDNENDIATNAHDISANTTAINQKVTNVVAGGGVDVNQTGSDVNISLSSDFITIHSSAFTVSNEISGHCVLKRGNFESHFDTSSTDSACTAYAPVALPHGAKITKIGCWAVHNDASVNTTITLRYMYATSTSATSGTAATLTYDSVGAGNIYLEKNASISNNAYNHEPSYFIVYDPSAPNTAGVNEKIRYCKVYYEYH